MFSDCDNCLNEVNRQDGALVMATTWRGHWGRPLRAGDSEWKHEKSGREDQRDECAGQKEQMQRLEDSE